MPKLRLIAECALACALAPGAFGQAGVTCKRVLAPVVKIRAESLAELLPDLVLDCTGGTPTASGASVPQLEILVLSNTPLSNRVVEPKTPATLVIDGPLPPVLFWNDALLLVDDPPGPKQIACTPVEGRDSCSAKGGSTIPNVFQGMKLQANAAVFRHVPLDPPGPGRTRRIRITNLRANATKIPATPLPKAITLNTQIFDSNGNLIPVENAEQTVGVPQSSIKISMRTADDGEVSIAAPALIVTPVMIPQNTPNRSLGFNVKFTETIPGAFRRRNLGTNGGDPNFLVNQTDPGGSFNTESGLFNGHFPASNDLNLAGLADSGTRLKVTFTGIPDNVFLYVSSRDVAAGTTGYSDTPRGLLTYTDANGYGSFLQDNGISGYSILYPNQGSATAVWEIMAADADRLEDISFNIRLIAPNGIARLGTALMKASFGPVFPGVTVLKPPSEMPIPAFMEDPLTEPAPAFRVVPTLNMSDLISVSAATYTSTTVAPESIVAGFGSQLTTVTEVAGSVPVSRLAGLGIDLIDNSGVKRSAPLFLGSPGQINFLVNPGTAMGEAIVNVTSNSQSVATGYLRIASVAPGLFSAAGTGKGTALGESVQSGGKSVSLTEPVDMGSASAPTYLTLYGTGIRGRSDLSAVSVSVGGVPVPVTYAGAHSQMAGVDQVNAGPLPQSLRGKGEVPVELVVDGKSANPLTIQIR